jgi:membrane fusion protein (multidrug efflux system)
MSSPQTPSADAVAQNRQTRRRGLGALAVLVLVAGAATLIYRHMLSSHFEETDNAYVQADVVQITPQIGGTVLAVRAQDTDSVQAGQPLVQLDPADAEVALQQAQAALGQAVRQARSLVANNAVLAAQVQQRQADVARAQSLLQRAQDDLARRSAVRSDGAVSEEEVAHAREQVASGQDALSAAQAALQAAREQALSNQALTEGVPLAQLPSVQAAAARLREAWLATQRTTLIAPLTGAVARRSVQVGQRVAAGSPLMSVIALNQLWVDANFKEGQLAQIKPGQSAALVSDQYGKDVVFHGHVVGVGAGTGAAFALLPAQNATGNWIKVVQRLPVRVALDAHELAEHPLRVGLSMTVEVDVASPASPPAAAASAPSPASVGEPDMAGADALVARIIAANLGPGHVVSPAKAL